MLWQWATVKANYGGNWSALYCTGGMLRHPPLVAAENTYVFANSTGYDGQFYRYIAHDPLMRSDLQTFVDDARLRYRRILIPLLAYGFALRHPERIDSAYELTCLLAIGLGVYWSCLFARGTGLSAAWGLLFLFMPAIPVTVDRLVIDGGLAALTAGFVYYSHKPSWKLFVVLVCAALTRETGFLLVLASCAHLTGRREHRAAAVFSLSAVPAAAWYLYVQFKTAGHPTDISMVPLSSVVYVLRHPWVYPPGTQFAIAICAADYLALAGLLLAMALAFIWFQGKPSDPVRIAALLFAVMGVALQRTEHFENVYHFGRIYTPLLLCLSAVAAQYRRLWLIAPVAMMLPRLAIQFAPQVLGVWRSVASF